MNFIKNCCVFQKFLAFFRICVDVASDSFKRFHRVMSDNFIAFRFSENMSVTMVNVVRCLFDKSV